MKNKKRLMEGKKMEKAQRKMTVIRVEENKTTKQVAQRIVHKLKVKVKE